MYLRFDCDLGECTHYDLEDLIEHVFGDDVLPAPAERIYETLEEILKRENEDPPDEERGLGTKARENVVSVLDRILPPWHQLGILIYGDHYMDDITKNMAGRLNAFTDRILEALKLLGVDVVTLPVRTWTSIQFVPANEEEEIDEEDNKFLLPDLVLREGKNPVQEFTSDKLWPGILSYAYTTTTALDMEQNPRPSDTRAYLPDDELAEATADADDGEKYSDEEEDEEDTWDPEADLDEDELREADEEYESLPELREQTEDIPPLLTALEAGHLFFETQPGRRHVIGLTFSANAMRLVVVDHAGAVTSTRVFPCVDPAVFVRIFAGLLFCDPTHLGVDNTLSTKIDDQVYASVEGKEYQVLETVFASSNIRGAGTVCRRVQCEGVEYIMKDTWVAEGAGNTEVEIIRELDGAVEGIPRLEGLEIVQVGGKPDSTAFARENVTPPEDEKFEAPRVHNRYVLHPFAAKLEDFENKEELLGAFSDGITAHEKLVDRGILHQDVWITNIMLRPRASQDYLPHKKERRRGLLIDLEKACRIGPDGEGVQKGIRTGTPPGMSIRVLADDSDTAPHGPADDLESFLYAFLAICITCTGPASSPTIPTASTILATWDGYKPYTELAQAKMEQMSSEAAFERVLDDFTPYFRDLKPCARKLRAVVFGGEGKVTHAGMRRVFEEAAEELRRRASPRFTSPRLSLGKTRTPFGSPDRKFTSTLGETEGGLLSASNAPKSPFGSPSRTPLPSPIKGIFSSPMKSSPFSSPTKNSPFPALTPGPMGLFGGADKRKLDDSPELPEVQKRPRLAESIPPLVFEPAPEMSSRRKRADSMMDDSGL
ncbi:hypothetical protein EV121DRAFT_270626 [Schizophyllum commune]